MEGFLCFKFEGLIFGGAYTWKGLFSEFYGMLSWHVGIVWPGLKNPKQTWRREAPTL